MKILEAHIGDLTLANTADDEFITKHIVGTRVEDLSQVYNGKVTIKGTLKLSNVILENPTSMFVNQERFGLNVADYFWMKSVDQVTNLFRTTKFSLSSLKKRIVFHPSPAIVVHQSNH